MRRLDPLQNTGVLVNANTRNFLGSCFAFRYPSTFLTASHCVAGFEAGQVSLVLPLAGTQSHSPIEIVRHSKADVAIIRVPSVAEEDITWPQYELFDDQSWGQGFMSCGYPRDYSLGDPIPAARVFQGHIQRFLAHKSYLRYEYFAAELSIGCPQGLSGAPVFNPGFHGRLYGVVTENIKTSTELESIREVTEDGKTFSEFYHNVINYGVAVWLPAVRDWLDMVVPPVTNDETNRRAANQNRMAGR